MESICFINGTDNSCCMLPKDFLKLQSLVKEKFMLSYLPNVKKIKQLLSIRNDTELQDKIREFLKSSKNNDNKMLTNKLTVYFKESVKSISKSGLGTLALISWFKKLTFIYPQFDFSRHPCFLDMEVLPSYLNYLDFDKNYPFKKKQMYYVLLNIYYDEFVGHWTGIFCSLITNHIYFYDSLNREIPKAYLKLLENLYEEMYKVTGCYPKFWKNTIATQKKNKYCGVFQLHFIITILSQECKNEISESILSEMLEKNTNEHVIEHISNFLFVH